MYKQKLPKIRLAALAVGTGLTISISAFTPAVAAIGYAAAHPTPASALAADQQLATAIRNNDASGIENMLADDWAVVATSGGMAQGKNVFPDGIKSASLIRKTYELSDARVRVYGDVALVTSKVNTSGMFGGRPFAIMERQTDVLLWKKGSWQCVLTHETKVDPTKME
jgi:ketosteroid isomerase-like protein